MILLIAKFEDQKTQAFALMDGDPLDELLQSAVINVGAPPFLDSIVIEVMSAGGRRDEDRVEPRMAFMSFCWAIL